MMSTKKAQFPGLISYSGLDFYSQDDVWDLWDLPSDRFLMIGTDRLWLNDKLVGAIPNKGKCLAGLMVFWAEFFKETMGSFIVIDELFSLRKSRAFSEKFGDKLEERALLVKKIPLMPIRWFVGQPESGGTSIVAFNVAIGESLDHQDAVLLLEEWINKNGLRKNGTGEIIKARSLKRKMDSLSFSLFRKAKEHVDQRGLSLCCSVLNFGWLGGEPVLMGDFFTPNSSCLSLVEDHGVHPDDLVKVWLANHKWPKGSRVPKIPAAILREVTTKYDEILRRVKN